MTIEYGEGRITQDCERIPLPERPKLLADVAEGVYFVDKCNLAVDAEGYLRLAVDCTLLDPQGDEQIEEVLRVVKVGPSKFIVDRSHTFEVRQAYAETTYTHAGEFCFTDMGRMGSVIGIIDSPGELELAAPLIQKQFGFTLPAIVLSSGEEHE